MEGFFVRNLIEDLHKAGDGGEEIVALSAICGSAANPEALL